MKKRSRLKHGFGLIRHYGWKKDLLAVAAAFLCCFLLSHLSDLMSGARGVGVFDLSAAVMPFFGFILGIWGILGFLLYNTVSFISFAVGSPDLTLGLPVWYYILSIFSLVLYCALPSILWYMFPLKGEEEASYPRLDTSSHVIKYYLISVITIIAYLLFSTISSGFRIKLGRLALLMATWFTQYLDTVLIVGIPMLILWSVIRNRTITINERMVLAFLITGALASAIAGYLIYRNSLQLAPDLFHDYEKVLRGEAGVVWSDDGMNAVERYDTFWNSFSVVIAVMLNVLLAVEVLFMRSIEKKVTRPIVHLSEVLTDYADQEEDGFNPEEVREQCMPYRYGYGEVSDLTRTCVDMVGEIDTYTKNLQTVTAEKERIGAELDIASRIQNDMLPGIFPPFPDRTEIDLYASMTPAKEVGGDFYDFYFVDENHLALTIADVSGKGVPAALFMVISKTLLQNQTLAGGSPREVLTLVNHQLCQNNTSMMFCTVWLGILDVTTGKLVAANAGHEYPVLRRCGGPFEMMYEKHDPPLGLKDGLRFREYELQLAPGDCLFEYTDGVTEATDASEALFGEKRLEEALNVSGENDPEKLINSLYGSISEFVKDAPQFDDITMLCVKYLGKAEESGETKQARISVPADLAHLDEVMAFTEQQLESAGCGPDDQFTITVAVEEIFVNIANYAYDGKEGTADISFSFNEEDRMVKMVFTDSGFPFDPTNRPRPRLTSTPGNRPVGGLGIHIVKKTMDKVKYDYLAGKNTLTIEKHI